MKRKLINELLDWKESLQKKPIFLTGARGTGKSYLAYDFAKSFYLEYIYINFEREPYLFNLFTSNFDTLISDILKERFHLNDLSESILIIFDEIAFCPDIMKVIELVSNEALNFDIIAISSTFKDFSIPDNVFIPKQLFPLDFEEFLVATGNEWYIEVIKAHYNQDKSLPDIVHKELLALFEVYLRVGGMPLAVNEFINNETEGNVSEQHRILTNSYLFDVIQHTSDGEVLKINQVFSVIDKQLIKENRKFQYTLIRKGATQAIYSDAIQYITNTFYGINCVKLNDESNDLKQSFKLYMLDVGMLYSTIKTRDSIVTETIRKGLFENYIAQCLNSKGYNLSFWESSSQAKIDFIILKNQSIIPIEVMISNNTRSKNISVFKTKYNGFDYSIKISTLNFKYSNNVKYVPIYAAFCI